MMGNTWVLGDVEVGGKICLLLSLLYALVVTGKLVCVYRLSLALINTRLSYGT